MASYKREMAWINKKRAEGVELSELQEGLGLWSNKSKEKVMKKRKRNRKTI